MAYFRPHEVHTSIVQLCVANLSAAAAVGVSASIQKQTAWPDEFYLEDSRTLRDLHFLRPHELLKFDLGMGPALFKGDDPAVFEVSIRYAALDGRPFSFDETLRIESIRDFSNFQIYGLDDVARRLKEISESLRSIIGSRRLRVETYDRGDREAEQAAWEARRTGGSSPEPEG